MNGSEMILTNDVLAAAHAIAICQAIHAKPIECQPGLTKCQAEALLRDQYNLAVIRYFDVLADLTGYSAEALRARFIRV